MSEEAEEKRLPASEKKLRDARQKGQAWHSHDLVSAIALLSALAYLNIAWPDIAARVDRLLDVVIEATTQPFEAGIGRVSKEFGWAVLLTLLPLAIVVVVVTVLSAVIVMGGPVFSGEPIKPKFDNINPVKGLQRIVSMRNVVELAKGLVKLLLLSVLFVIILLAWLRPIVEAPGCGDTCLVPIILGIVTPLGFAAAIAFIVIGLADLPIQRLLFMRDMRMSTTEHRREHKDVEGDPLIQREFQRLRRETLSAPKKFGGNESSFVAVLADRAVGLRYVKGETPIPVVTAKGSGKAGLTIAAEARRHGIPVIEDRELLDALFKGSRAGEYIKPDTFPVVVRHLRLLDLL
ncbi:EscU/YscU/HrcU family type III secretion system export apparatus switch protein [Pseudaminobacter sp. 19-2017]|uniref:EscU/YscU/HrcU family type III secretion system export apparatus switch protein n=1 Tax=Pseudaminobacter soli (ex Zhang et al. 2022) TaxID=2831468 RepID=A0A942DVN0_9HYPH|nr:EscU/YscU/HrcU family type III secretion system export apparatus switch protein [Pseudaminobacter soli]MBS3647182.1 EscU/YscU/HrcU family type III secretion system export apparatus switch protein [Pseudaminobacter soli]